MVPAGSLSRRVGASVSAADGSVVASCLGSLHGSSAGETIARRDANARVIAGVGGLVEFARRVAGNDLLSRDLRLAALRALRDAGLAP
jgi:hypothetical protein